ncbi:hypothetical protein K4B79_15895 [Streptomyces lincolnensis]|uniref:hypothetical protein n=1 Tax=Streptomyces lincolnensis TaxID=1915 RepID=UPI001E513B90|nr:hypothetical protein [Streptomyces lincolnensis]MCD7439706.1 hypothetical protein [Streptomyces lincolnensis]
MALTAFRALREFDLEAEHERFERVGTERHRLVGQFEQPGRAVRGATVRADLREGLLRGEALCAARPPRRIPASIRCVRRG